MPKLYFKYGCMGSGKTALALITKFQWEEHGRKVAIFKPEVDNRDGAALIKSRVGLQSPCTVLTEDVDLQEYINGTDLFIVDEAQFLSEKRVETLKRIAIHFCPVMCFGLKTDFMTKLFPGSQRLLELADDVEEMEMVCKCGAKAEVNARMDGNGKIIKQGEQIYIGGNESYSSMCYRCWLSGQG